MDIDDLRDKFGHEYDDGIEQMKDHTDSLGLGDDGIPD